MGGVEREFAELYEECYPAVLRFALRRLGDAEAAQEAAADTFLVAWRRQRELPSGRDALPWLYAVARKIVANEHRRTRRATKLLTELLSDELNNASGYRADNDPAETVPDALMLASAFDSLRPEDQELLRLTAWEGLNPAQVGQVVGCSTGTAAVRAYRARRRLRNALSSDAEQVGAMVHPFPSNNMN